MFMRACFQAAVCSYAFINSKSRAKHSPFEKFIFPSENKRYFY